MKILINVSNIKKSGALQVALSVLNEIKLLKGVYEFEVIASHDIAKNIDIIEVSKDFKITIVEFKLPLQIGYYSYLKKLKAIEFEFSPDIVFSIFGPTYWTPKSPHLVGFAYGWAINPDSIFVKSQGIFWRWKFKVVNSLKLYYFRKNSGFFVVETEEVKKRLIKYGNIRAENIWVVSNTYNHYFNGLQNIHNRLNVYSYNRGFHLVTISSNFPHKNLRIIKNVDLELKRRGIIDVFFHVSISDKDFSLMFSSKVNIINHGIVKPSDCPIIYSEADALFLPTLMECFSASYPEAMIMGLPILTSDLGFAHSICGDAALYFNPFSEFDIADQILKLRSDVELYKSLKEKGNRRVKEFPTSQLRAQSYFLLCHEILQIEKEMK